MADAACVHIIFAQLACLNRFSGRLERHTEARRQAKHVRRWAGLHRNIDGGQIVAVCSHTTRAHANCFMIRRHAGVGPTTVSVSVYYYYIGIVYRVALGCVKTYFHAPLMVTSCHSSHPFGHNEIFNASRVYAYVYDNKALLAHGVSMARRGCVCVCKSRAHLRKSVLSFTQIQSDVAKTHLVLLGYGVSCARAPAWVRNNTSDRARERER